MRKPYTISLTIILVLIIIAIFNYMARLEYIVAVLIAEVILAAITAITFRSYLLVLSLVDSYSIISLTTPSPSFFGAEASLGILLFTVIPTLLASVLVSLIAIRLKTRDYRLINNIKASYELLRGEATTATNTYIVALGIILASLFWYWFCPRYLASAALVMVANSILGLTLILPQLFSIRGGDDYIMLVTSLITLPFSLIPLLVWILARDYEVEILREKGGICIGEIKGVLEEYPLEPLQIGFLSLRRNWWLNKAEGNYCMEVPYELGSPHILVTGSTGSGKTTTAAKIIEELGKTKTPIILVIDPHGEYGKLLGENGKTFKGWINPLIPLGIKPKDRALQVVEELKLILGLGELQAAILLEALIDAYTSKGYELEKTYEDDEEAPSITFDDVLEALRERLKLEPTNTSLISLIRKIEILGRVSKVKHIDLKNLMKFRLAIIDLSIATTTEQKYIQGETLLRYLYYYASKGIAKRPIIIVVDEAHLFAPKTTRIQKPILVKSLQELRKYKVSFIVVTQNISEIHDEMINNVGYLIALRTIEPQNLEKTIRILAGSPEREKMETLAHILSNLPQGYALVKDPRTTAPLLVKIQSPRS
ncbi:MAG: ATP-binding protein [Pyrodictiaceae archaeon]